MTKKELRLETLEAKEYAKALGAVDSAIILVPSILNLIARTPAQKRRKLIKDIGKDIRRLNKRLHKGKISKGFYEMQMEQLIAVYDV